MTNDSAMNATNPRQSFPVAFHVGAATFTVILVLGTIFGNVLVIAAFSLHLRMRTVTNYFVVSLACSDLCVALFSMPVWAAYLLTGPMWVLGETLSRVWTVIDILMGTASIMNLMAISFDRYLCITSPLRYLELMTTSRVIFIIACVWIYSLGIAIAGFILYDKPIFMLVEMILCFCIPLVVIIIAYSIIFKVALRHITQIHTAMPSHNHDSHNSFMKELKAAKTLAVVVGAFVICWAPFVTLNVIYSLCSPILGCPCPVISPEIILATKWMHYGNSLLNPLIYAFTNRDFRTAFKALLCSRNRSFLELALSAGPRRTAEAANSLPMA